MESYQPLDFRDQLPQKSALHVPAHLKSEYSEKDLTHHLAAVVVSSDQIMDGIRHLSTALVHDYRQRRINDLVVVNVLDGATPTYNAICAELRNELMFLEYDALKATRYGKKIQGEQVELTIEPEFSSQDVKHRDVLIIEDLVDEGNTALWLLNFYAQQNPASLRLVSLIQKPGKLHQPFPERINGVRCDYFPAMYVEDHWLVGFGMDLSFSDEKGDHVLYRELPDVTAASPGFLKEVGHLDERKAAPLEERLRRAA